VLQIMLSTGSPRKYANEFLKPKAARKVAFDSAERLAAGKQLSPYSMKWNESNHLHIGFG
jgi:hypothetical protein